MGNRSNNFCCMAGILLDWQIWLDLYTKPEIPDEKEIEYVLIITIESLFEHGVLDLYGEIESTNR